MLSCSSARLSPIGSTSRVSTDYATAAGQITLAQSVGRFANAEYGGIVVIGMEDDTTLLYDTKSRKTLQNFRAQSVGMLGFAGGEWVTMSPDGAFLAFLENGNTVAVYTVRDR